MKRQQGWLTSVCRASMLLLASRTTHELSCNASKPRCTSCWKAVFSYLHGTSNAHTAECHINQACYAGCIQNHECLPVPKPVMSCQCSFMFTTAHNNYHAQRVTFRCRIHHAGQHLLTLTDANTEPGLVQEGQSLGPVTVNM